MNEIINNEWNFPEDICKCSEIFKGNSDFLIYIVSTAPSHAPHKEKQVVDTLLYLHSIHSIEWVLFDFDAAEKNGYLEAGQPEFNTKPYRNYPNIEITKGICDYMMNTGFMSSGQTFGIICKDTVHIQAFDDWYHWANQRDAKLNLNLHSGKLELLSQLLKTDIPKLPIVLDEFIRLVNLEYSVKEWESYRTKLESFDIKSWLTSSDLNVTQFLSLEQISQYKELANEFYESNIQRISIFMNKAIQKIKDTNTRIAAFTVSIPWTDYLADMLKKNNINYIKVIPKGVSMSSILKEVSNSGSLDEGHTSLGELFSGLTIKDQIEHMESSTEDYIKKICSGWDSAAHALAYEYNYETANLCISKSLFYNKNNVNALHNKAGVCVEQGKHLEAIDYCKHAISLKPNAYINWQVLGAAYRGLGKSKLEKKAFLYSIYLNPKQGGCWCNIGLYYHYNNQSYLACYCFKKGMQLGNPESTQNYNAVCSRKKILLRPLRFSKIAIYIMQNIWLPWQFSNNDFLNKF